MAEYSERTGQVKWQRVVLASQREQIEKWLGEHYPVQPQPQAAPARSVAPKTERAAVRSAPAAGRRSSSRG
jgi:hypothetical protein